MLEIVVIREKRLITRYKGKELSWPYTVWGKLNNELTEDIFGPCNEYAKVLPESVLDVIWENYERAHEAFLTIGNQTSLREELTEVCSGIAKAFDFGHIKKWATTDGKIQPELDLPESYLTNNSKAMTILRSEALDISIYSIIVKFTAPILGQYTQVVREFSSNTHKERLAARIIIDSAFSEFEAYERIELYVKELANARARSLETALMWGMPKSDLDRFLLGHVIIRRLIIRKLRNIPNRKPEPNLVAFIYKYLEDKINVLNNSNYREKFPQGQSSSQESDSVTDQFRIAQDIADHIPIGIEHYAEDITRLCRHVGITDTDEIDAVLNVRSAIGNNERYVLVESIHLALPAIVFRHHIEPFELRHLERPARLNLIAITYVKALKMGLNDVAALFLAVRQPADIHSIQMGTQNGKHFRRLTPELDALLSAQYPHVEPKEARDNINPARRLIEFVVKEIDGSTWMGLDDVPEIRNSIAKFIIERD